MEREVRGDRQTFQYAGCKFEKGKQRLIKQVRAKAEPTRTELEGAKQIR